MVNLGSAYGEVIIGTQGSEKQLQSLASTLRGVGTTMSAAISAPLIGVAAAGLKAAAGFEQSMNMLQVATGATEQAMQGLQDKALQLGAETSFSAGEAADAMLELAKAGMSADQTMQAIGGVMDLAAAGGVALAEAATITAAALNAFHLPASEAANVANLLAAAANASAADITDLAQGLQQGGFAFGAAGQGVDDLVASLAILTNVGLTGSDAGTALKNAMMRLMNPTKKAAELMDELGINAYDAQGNMLPFADVIDEINQGTKGMTQEQRNAALSTIFLSDGMKAFIPLLDAGKDGFLAMKEEVNQEGAAAEMAAARMKGLQGAIEYIKGSIESMLIEVALPFLDFLSNTIRRVADTITQFTKLPTPIRNAVLAFLAVMAAIGPVSLALGSVGAVMAALLSPIGLLGIALATLAAVWVADLGGIQGKTAAAWAAIRSVFEVMTAWLQVNVPAALGVLSSALSPLGAYFGAVVEDGDYLNDWLTHLPELIRPVVQWLGQLTASLLNLVNGPDLAALQTSVINALSEVGGAVHDFFSGDISLGGLAGAVSQGLTDIKNALAGFFGGSDFQGVVSTIAVAWNGLVAAVQTAWDSIDWSVVTGTLNKITTAVSDFFTGIDWSVVTGPLSGLATSVATYLGEIDWAGVLTKLQTGANSLRDGVLASVTGAINGIDWSGASLSLSGMIDWISEKINAIDFSTINVVDIGKALVGVLVPGLNTAIAGIQWVLSSENWAGLVTAVTSGFTSIKWGELGASLLGLVTAIGGAIAELDWSSVTSTFETLKSSISTAIEPAATAFSTALTSISDAITNFKPPTLEEIGTTLNTFRDDAVQALADAFTGLDLTEKISGLLTALTSAITGTDWSAIGSTLGTAVSFVLSADSLKAIFATAVTAIAPALTAAIAGIAWVMSSENWSNLTTAVMDSITNIDWSAIGEKFSKLKDAIGTALGDFAEGFTGAFQTPAWLAELMAWKFPSPTELIAWAWPDYSKWTWPAYLTWAWPAYLTWTWPAYLTWVWSPYLTWTWPEIPTPAWLGTLLNWSPSWPSWLGGGGDGESSGSSVVGSGVNASAFNGGMNITINVAGMNGEMDWNRAAKRIAREVVVASR